MDIIFFIIIGILIGGVTAFYICWSGKGGDDPDYELINKKLDKIMATQAQHAQELRDVVAQNEKARVEILAKIADLETALANAGSTTPEVDEALAALKASVQTDDDIVPDVVTQ